MQTHDEMRRRHVLIPRDMQERADRLEATLVEIKRLLEVIAARQLVIIDLLEDPPPTIVARETD